MGLLDELERKGRGKRRPAQRIILREESIFGGTRTRIVTASQLGRMRNQHNRQKGGAVLAGAGWVVGLILISSGALFVIAGAGIIMVSTVGGILLAFSHSDRELKRHARWTWREVKKFLTGK